MSTKSYRGCHTPEAWRSKHLCPIKHGLISYERNADHSTNGLAVCDTALSISPQKECRFNTGSAESVIRKKRTYPHIFPVPAIPDHHRRSAPKLHHMGPLKILCLLPRRAIRTVAEGSLTRSDRFDAQELVESPPPELAAPYTAFLEAPPWRLHRSALAAIFPDHSCP